MQSQIQLFGFEMYKVIRLPDYNLHVFNTKCSSSNLQDFEIKSVDSLLNIGLNLQSTLSLPP